MSEKDLFEWMLPDTWERLTFTRWHQETRPEIFDSMRSSEANPWVVESRGWVSERGTLNLRFTAIRTPRANIVTIMIYPIIHPDRMPIFAAEWVAFGDTIRPAVLDVHPGGRHPNLMESLAETFGPLGERWRSVFPEAPECPEWFREIKSAWSIFSSMPVSDTARLREMYREYLDATALHFYRPREPLSTGHAEHQDILTYKHHHFEHSPGRKLLATKFPSAWVEEFLRDWHFGPVVKRSEPNSP